MRYFLSVVASCGLCIVSSLSSCQREDIDCQSPPPTFYFDVVDKQNVSLITSANRGTVKLSYPTAAGKQTYLADLQVDATAGNRSYVATRELIDKAQQLNPIAFTVEVDNRRVGSLQLTTYKNNDTCDGWTHPDKVSFNGNVVTQNAQNLYVLVVE